MTSKRLCAAALALLSVAAAPNSPPMYSPPPIVAGKPTPFPAGFPVEENCKRVYGTVSDDCIASEQSAYDILRWTWDKYSEKTKSFCMRWMFPVNGHPTPYSMLMECILDREPYGQEPLHFHP